MENPASDPPDVVVEQEPEEVEGEIVQGDGLGDSALAVAHAKPEPTASQQAQDAPAPSAEKQQPVNENRMVIEGTMGTWQPRKGKPPGRFILHTEQGDYDIKFWDEKLAAGRGEGRGAARCTIELVASGRYKDYFLVAPIEWPECTAV
jgi:hypothetical protein